jgi:hypothetical protein
MLDDLVGRIHSGVVDIEHDPVSILPGFAGFYDRPM